MIETPSSIAACDLTEEDLRRHALWQFVVDAGPEADESHLVPVAASPARTDYGSYFVAATFSDSAGRTYPGAVQLDQMGRKRYLTPAVIFVVSKSLDPLARDIGARLRRIRKTTPARLVSWRVEIVLEGEKMPRSGRILSSRVLLILALALRLVQLRCSRVRK